jgi:hypothetical protein
MERGIYIVTERSWTGTPQAEAGILYIGQTGSLRYRVGHLVAEILGFTNEAPGSVFSYFHSGGHTIWTDYCLQQNVEPLTLNIGWTTKFECLNCAESELIRKFNPGYNASLGKICRTHVPPLSLGQNSSDIRSL